MSRQRYERPQIIRHEHTIGNQFGAQRGRRVLERIDGVAVADLLGVHGSPLFVFSEAALRSRAEEARMALSRYPRVCFAWSYKTNHLDAICAFYHQAGWYAEVVSEAEYEMARRLGVPGDRIIFNGAYKPRRALKRAAREGALVQIDHFEEIEMLEEIAEGRTEPLPVGIRVNLHIPSLGAQWDRFGFNLESGDAEAALRRLKESAGLKLLGLHCHIGTFITQPQAYREAARRMAAIFKDAERLLGHPIEVLNLGGGLPSRNAPYTQYGAAEDAVPPLMDFGNAICDELLEAFIERERWPLLVLESGRALVDDAGTLLATVVGTRRIPGGRALVLDAGVNLLYTAAWYRHDVLPTQDVPGLLEPTTLLGPLCMAIDVLRRGVPLPPLEAGHHVALRPVGAYNVTQWMQFSQLRPRVVLIGEGGRVEVIREAETVEYLKEVEPRPRFQVKLDGDSDLPGRPER